jgi:hypothetical protein
LRVEAAMDLKMWEARGKERECAVRALAEELLELRRARIADEHDRYAQIAISATSSGHTVHDAASSSPDPFVAVAVAPKMLWGHLRGYAPWVVLFFAASAAVCVHSLGDSFPRLPSLSLQAMRALWT